MKLGFGLYRHMLNKALYKFTKQCGATHLVVHLVDYFEEGKILQIPKKNNFEGVVIPNRTPQMSYDALWQGRMNYAMGYLKAAISIVNNNGNSIFYGKI